MSAKPFLKWAGGKTQLLSELIHRLPAELEQQNFTYAEPFLGSGAMLFWMLRRFPNLEKVVVNDVNTDLINVYKTVATQVEDLIVLLENMQSTYRNTADQKVFFYEKRKQFNSRQSDNLTHAALFIFLNKTCFNGLYRVNRKNEFNVPIGAYKNPTICQTDNLRAAHQLLQKVIFLNTDFEKVADHFDTKTFVYLDPPYKPLSETSNFNAYAAGNFNDAAQIRLADFCKKLHQQGHLWLLSNSDPGEDAEGNNFFEELYQSFSIERVLAKRNINSKASKRGKLNELLIKNY